jgi:hypothetical protein
MTAMASVTFPTDHMKSIQKIIDQASGLDSVARQINESQAALTKMLDPSISALKVMSYDEQLQKSIAAMASTFTASMDTSRMQDILATATTLRQGLSD